MFLAAVNQKASKLQFGIEAREFLCCHLAISVVSASLTAKPPPRDLAPVCGPSWVPAFILDNTDNAVASRILDDIPATNVQLLPHRATLSPGSPVPTCLCHIFTLPWSLALPPSTSLTIPAHDLDLYSSERKKPRQKPSYLCCHSSWYKEEGAPLCCALHPSHLLLGDLAPSITTLFYLHWLLPSNSEPCSNFFHLRITQTPKPNLPLALSSPWVLCSLCLPTLPR